MLQDEIEAAQRHVRTDAYQMSIGELVSMYEHDEITIAPDFQRLFRWEIGQKSKLIESILLGIPLPSIFVFEIGDGEWELIDGLQRLSTILEFMGKLRDADGKPMPPSALEATKYLPSLHNAVWEKSEDVIEVPTGEQNPLDRAKQLAIRRARIGVEILKRPSDNNTKFDLFQRLNAGGTAANEQEIRNCIMLMVNENYFRAIKAAAESDTFLKVTSLTDGQLDKQRHIELAARFLVHVDVPYDGLLDVGEYIDEGIVQLASAGDIERATSLLTDVFALLKEVADGDALRRYQNGHYSGRVGLVGLETIAVGVAKNLPDIQKQPDPVGFVRDRSQKLWEQEEIERFLSPGVRGTARIQKTVPFGEHWFRP
ncbi:DUF262 domain-containing protein [Rhodovulum sulfidophilum]|uniref:GmrSD restriction endonuclease domain-containing protein n=1 Tax=Rhodovulum sulfidophilum TaxID=35806 RepID=UPI001921FD0F|nr:DUF262 domain-containing protein [Rhodovulum sulfidophilum]MBL3565967.1 DUF262 domain-containing protein [Rhodovulum sulfidophilum]